MEIKDIENLAELAKLELSEEEKASLLADLESILGYIQQIESAEIEDKQEKYALHNVWRDDQAQARDFSQELITSQFPDAQDSFLKVKKIL